MFPFNEGPLSLFSSLKVKHFCSLFSFLKVGLRSAATNHSYCQKSPLIVLQATYEYSKALLYQLSILGTYFT